MSVGSRVFEILRLFIDKKEIWTVDELIGELQCSPSTVYRAVRLLTKERFLYPMTGARYMLGSAFIEYERVIRKTDSLLAVGAAELKSLVENVDTPSIGLLCRFYRDSVMCVHQEQSPQILNSMVSYERGLPMPLFRGATSRVILANLPNRQMRRIYDQFVEEIAAYNQGSDWKSFMSNMRVLRQQGYCIARGEVDRGVVGIAAPIILLRGTNNEDIGSISLALPKVDLDEVTINDIAQKVKDTAKRIEEAMSGE
jgi:DNA-binding IclR family transcriptional regulator